MDQGPPEPSLTVGIRMAFQCRHEQLFLFVESNFRQALPLGRPFR